MNDETCEQQAKDNGTALANLFEAMLGEEMACVAIMGLKAHLQAKEQGSDDTSLAVCTTHGKAMMYLDLSKPLSEKQFCSLYNAYLEAIGIVLKDRSEE